MSLHAYVSFLIRRFNWQDENSKDVTLFTNLSNRWFGLLPFLWNYVVKDTKK